MQSIILIDILKTFKRSFNYALYGLCDPQFAFPKEQNSGTVKRGRGSGMASGSLGKFTHKLTRSKCNFPRYGCCHQKLKVQRFLPAHKNQTSLQF